MGMAASQGRLLFMTARLSNNEFEQQCVAYSKQRLADDSQTANDNYLEALSATQYQVITGYNGDTPTYEPVTYNQLTGLGNVATGKQYIVSDNTGKIVVTQTIANAFQSAQGDYNKFLKNIGIATDGRALTQVSETNLSEEDVHNAWDEYFTSVNRGDTNGIYYTYNADKDGNLIDSDHVLGIAYHAGKNVNGGDDVAYCTYNAAYTQGSSGNRIYLQEDKDGNYFYNNYEVQTESYTDDYGNTKYHTYFVMPETVPEYDENGNFLNDLNLMKDGNKFYLDKYGVTYDGKNFQVGDKEYSSLYVDQDFIGQNEDGSKYLKLTEDEKRTGNFDIQNDEQTIFYTGTNAEQRQLYDYAMAVSEKYADGSSLTYDADKVQYYENIYNQMTTKGYTTYKEMTENKYINTQSTDEKEPFKSDEWLITLLKQGKLAISYYSSTEKEFIATSLDDDESITEKENKSKMAIAEQEYNTHMDKIESEDKRFDMQLSKLESEHTALQTEYESVAKVISKNVEKSFNTFSA